MVETKQSLTIPLLEFNAKAVQCDDLETTLVGRKEIVDEIFQELYEKLIHGETYQSLLIAPRGSGKTHLTKVIYCRLKSRSEISSMVRVAYMIEDEYGISSFIHLLLQIISAIQRYNEPGSDHLSTEVEKISAFVQTEKEPSLKKLLIDYLEDKKLIVLLENFDVILAGLGREAAKLRDFMHEHNKISLVTTSQSLSKELKDSNYPFYHFFRTRHLAKLNFEESLDLIKALARIENNETIKNNINDEFLKNAADIEAKIRAIYELTGGNHRLIVHFYSFLKADLKSELSQVFLKQMNDLKAYYEQFAKSLSPQQQRIIQIVSLHRGALTSTTIAAKSFIEINTVTKQLSELYKLGYVDKSKSGKEVFYELKEPLMRICFEINENPNGVAGLFMNFLKAIYTPRILQKKYIFYKSKALKAPSEDSFGYETEAAMYQLAFDNTDPVFNILNMGMDSNSENVRGYEDVDIEFVKAIEQLQNNCLNLIKVNDIDKCFETINKAILIDPNNSRLFAVKARCYLEMHQLDDAIDSYKKATELDHNFARAYHGLGYTLKAKGMYDEAILNYMNAIEMDPNNADTFNGLGVSLKSVGRVDEAIIQYQKAIELDPKFKFAYNNLGNALNERGMYNEAIKQYQFAIELNPKYVDAYNGLGVSLKSVGRVEEAIVEYQKAIELDSNFTFAYCNLGIALGIVGKFDEANSNYMKAIELDPKYADAYNGLGISLKAQGKSEEAIKYYLKAIEFDSKEKSAFYNLGNVLWTIGKYDEAISQYQKAIELDPKYADAYNGLGLSLKAMAKFEEAIKQYLKAIELNPKEKSAFYNLGNALWALDRYDEAILQYQKAIELDPKYADAHNSLGISLKALGKFDEAIKHYLKAIELDPNEKFAFYNLGNALGAQDRYDEAIPQYLQAIKLDPNFKKAYYNLGLALVDVDRYDEAIVQFHKAIELDHEYVRGYYGLGRAFWGIGEYVKAIEQYQKALDLNPLYKFAYFNLLISYTKIEAFDDFCNTISKYSSSLIDNISVTDIERLFRILIIDISVLKKQKFLQVIDTEFKKSKNQKLLYEAWIIFVQYMLGRIRKIDESLPRILLQYLEKEYQGVSEMILPIKFLKIGISYLIDNNEKVIFEFSKEERDLFMKMIENRLE